MTLIFNRLVEVVKVRLCKISANYV